MSAVSEGVLIVAVLLRQEILKKYRKKRCWVKKWIARREVLGASNNLCLELRTENEDDFKNMFRVNRTQFNYLLHKIGSCIQRQNTTMRNAIPARTKLEIALKYLATGDSLGTLSQLFRVPECTISTFFVEVLEAIYSALEDFIKVPRSEEDWNEIRRGFLMRWNFPNCIGAIDGKHINVKCPPGTGSDFFNYKSTFSIVLLACVDHDYCFTYIDVGAKGRNSDGGIFNNCTLKKAIEENTIHVPSNSVLVGDEAFPLKPYLMKPYPRRNDLTREQKIYNYRLCRCRRIVENAFGVLTARFRVFEKPITTSIDKVDVIVKASTALHNWLRKTSPASYTPPGFIDEECPRSDLRLGTWRENTSGGAFENITPQNRNSTREAIKIRENYCHYFNNDDAVPWQDNAIF